MHRPVCRERGLTVASSSSEPRLGAQLTELRRQRVREPPLHCCLRRLHGTVDRADLIMGVASDMLAAAGEAAVVVERREC